MTTSPDDSRRIDPARSEARLSIGFPTPHPQVGEEEACYGRRPAGGGGPVLSPSRRATSRRKTPALSAATDALVHPMGFHFFADAYPLRYLADGRCVRRQTPHRFLSHISATGNRNGSTQEGGGGVMRSTTATSSSFSPDRLRGGRGERAGYRFSPPPPSADRMPPTASLPWSPASEAEAAAMEGSGGSRRRRFGRELTYPSLSPSPSRRSAVSHRSRAAGSGRVAPPPPSAPTRRGTTTTTAVPAQTTTILRPKAEPAAAPLSRNGGDVFPTSFYPSASSLSGLSSSSCSPHATALFTAAAPSSTHPTPVSTTYPDVVLFYGNGSRQWHPPSRETRSSRQGIAAAATGDEKKKRKKKKEEEEDAAGVAYGRGESSTTTTTSRQATAASHTRRSRRATTTTTITKKKKTKTPASNDPLRKGTTTTTTTATTTTRSRYDKTTTGGRSVGKHNRDARVPRPSGREKKSLPRYPMLPSTAFERPSAEENDGDDDHHHHHLHHGRLVRGHPESIPPVFPGRSGVSMGVRASSSSFSSSSSRSPSRSPRPLQGRGGEGDGYCDPLVAVDAVLLPPPMPVMRASFAGEGPRSVSHLRSATPPLPITTTTSCQRDSPIRRGGGGGVVLSMPAPPVERSGAPMSPVWSTTSFSSTAFRQFRLRLYVFLVREGPRLDTALCTYRRALYLSADVVEHALECAAMTSVFMDQIVSWRAWYGKDTTHVTTTTTTSVSYAPSSYQSYPSRAFASAASLPARREGPLASADLPHGDGDAKRKEKTMRNVPSGPTDVENQNRRARPEKEAKPQDVNQRLREEEMLLIFWQDCDLLHRKAQYLIHIWDHPSSSSSALEVGSFSTPRRHCRSFSRDKRRSQKKPSLAVWGGGGAAPPSGGYRDPMQEVPPSRGTTGEASFHLPSPPPTLHSFSFMRGESEEAGGIPPVPEALSSGALPAPLSIWTPCEVRAHTRWYHGHTCAPS